jgi:hypothetical protein
MTARTVLIVPDALEYDAVVPQCLDNQYVSDSAFAELIDKSLDYEDAAIDEMRERDFRTEFMRSLIYSSQIVVQRAYLKNSHFLRRNFEPKKTEGGRRNFDAFAQLIRDRAIVPFLFKESSLTDGVTFDLHEEGDRVLKALLDELDEVACVRLAIDDRACERAASAMDSAFGNGIERLGSMLAEQRSALAEELFKDKSGLHEEGGWEAFNGALDRMLLRCRARNDELRRKHNRLISRSDVYRDNFVVDGKDAVVRGQFKKPDRDNPFLFELKKYIDLVYNVNLPDHLKRYTFTPENMPSRLAMQDWRGEGFADGDVRRVIADADAIESMRRVFMAHVQRPMRLPLLSMLTVSDVQEIRALPEWETFKNSQAAILKAPLQCLDRIEQFQRNFDAFQRALSRWHTPRRSKESETSYCNFITLALSLGGKLAVAGAPLGAIERVAGTFVVDQVVKALPKKITSYAAKLMVNVYDVGAKRLDADRSYSIELMQANCDLVREDVVELLRAIHAEGPNALPPAEAQTADQGK